MLKDRKTTAYQEIKQLDIYKGLDISILDELVRVMKKLNIYIWCNKTQLYDYLCYFMNKTNIFEIIIWNNTNPTPLINNTYLPDKEYCLFFRESSATFNLSTVETKRTVYTTKCNVEDKAKYKHPTIKPISIIKNLITNSSKEGDIVLDCFSGSGTTCVAAKELNRQFIGIEINPEYHRISMDRLNGMLANGQISFDTDISKILGG